MYIALIGDLINSKQLTQRAAFQEQLKSILQTINRTYKQQIVSPFTLTVGDEFQAILHATAPWLFIIESITEQLHPVQIRFGVGVGTIITTIDPKQSIGADGPAYWFARDAINYIHDKNDYGMNGLAIQTANQELNQTVNTLIATTAYMKSTWTASQKNFFAALLAQHIYTEKFEQKTIAQTLNLSESAFTKRLKSGGVKIYFRAREHVQQSIQTYASETIETKKEEVPQ